MQISTIAAVQAGGSAVSYPGGIPAATAALHDPQGDPAQQLKAYQALAGQWRQSAPAMRAVLAQTLVDSPFGQKVQATLNAFTRAAWAGPDATPPQPQIQQLKAFDNLSPEDQEIVAGAQVDGSGRPAYASGADYRAKLQADLDAAQPDNGRAQDTVTLSPEAQASLAGAPTPAAAEPTSTPSADPQVAAALAAYAKAAR
jgi:hypothetical protein